MDAVDIGLWVGEKLITGVVSNIGGSLLDLGLGEIYPLIECYPDPEKFKKEVRENMKQMNTKLDVITDKLDIMQNSLVSIYTEMGVIKSELKKVESAIIYQVIQSEIAVRMTIINTYISKIEYLFERYQSLSKAMQDNKLLLDKENTETSATVLYNSINKITVLSKKFDNELSKYNIPELLHFINSELIDDTAGSKKPILKLMKEQFILKCPFVHEYGEAIYRFANYMALIQTQGLYLYKEVCSRAFSDPTQRDIAYKEEYDKLEENLKLQYAILPDEKDAFLVTKYDEDNNPLECRLVSNYNGLALNVSLVRQPVFIFRYYSVLAGEYKEYLNDPTPAYYKEFFKVKEAYAKGENIREFMFKHAGGMIDEYLSCKPEWLEQAPAFERDNPILITGWSLPFQDMATLSGGYGPGVLPVEISYLFASHATFMRAWNTDEPPKPYQIEVKYTTYLNNGKTSYSHYGESSNSPTAGIPIAVRIQLIGNPPDTHIEYRVHVSNLGWTPYVRDNEMAGTLDTNKKIEAIQIRLVNLNDWTAQYAVCLENGGYMEASDDMKCGTEGKRRSIKLFRLRVLTRDRLASLTSRE